MQPSQDERFENNRSVESVELWNVESVGSHGDWIESNRGRYTDRRHYYVSIVNEPNLCIVCNSASIFKSMDIQSLYDTTRNQCEDYFAKDFPPMPYMKHTTYHSLVMEAMYLSSIPAKTIFDKLKHKKTRLNQVENLHKFQYPCERVVAILLEFAKWRQVIFLSLVFAFSFLFFIATECFY